MSRITYLLLLMMIAFSCKEGSKSSNKSAANSAPEMISQDIITELTKTVTSIDLISLKKNVNVSMSFDNPQAVQYVLSFAQDEKGEFDGTCPADGRVVFLQNGENSYDAEVYFSGNCNSYIWIKNGQRIGSSKISPEGIDFFKNFLKPNAKPLTDSTQTPH
ncbi:MAG TPA: hypothetical protein PKD32_09985 [Saprospiraceae bacterium]|jgi:hypothetical protein|nr:hypothetical protein [Saprospiraceae bacterium]HMS30172.1 hypothetical protein [Saprospiraceae bacterium]